MQANCSFTWKDILGMDGGEGKGKRTGVAAPAVAREKALGRREGRRGSRRLSVDKERSQGDLEAMFPMES